MDFLGLLDLGVDGVIEQRTRAAGKEKHLVCMDCITILALVCLSYLVEHFASVYVVDGIGCFQKKWSVMEKGFEAPKHRDGIGRFGKDWIGKVDILAWQRHGTQGVAGRDSSEVEAKTACKFSGEQ